MSFEAVFMKQAELEANVRIAHTRVLRRPCATPGSSDSLEQAEVAKV